ncbi:MAG: helix-turn-helix domain-containing protein [Pasteurellaceae bacterium]|nr:helix-turn-helix domain-containing protein [Pasteurellaceae bacterium]
MDSFKGKLIRLKNELNVETDKEVAEYLGMTNNSFTVRKSRNSFPEKELFALKAKRPELNLDMDYILLGHRRETYEAMEKEALKDMPKADFSDKTGLLVQLFLQCDDQGRAAILSVAQTMAAMAKTTQGNYAAKMHIDKVEQQNNIEHLEGGIHFNKEK